NTNIVQHKYTHTHTQTDRQRHSLTQVQHKYTHTHTHTHTPLCVQFHSVAFIGPVSPSRSRLPRYRGNNAQLPASHLHHITQQRERQHEQASHSRERDG